MIPLLLGAVLAAAPAPAPSPSPSPLRTIVRVRSSPFCTALRANVGHAIGGLLLNDRLVDQGRSDLVKLAHDDMLEGELTSAFNQMGPASLGPGGPAVTLDLNRLDAVVGSIVHNLSVVDAILNDPARFPPQPKTEDDRQMLQLKAQIAQVADAQREALNLLTGPSETYRLGDMMTLPVHAPSATGKVPQNVNAQNYFGGGPLQKLLGTTASGDPQLKQTNTLPAGSPWAGFYGRLAANQTYTQNLESPLAQSVGLATASCR